MAILVVDDSEDMRDLLGTVLSSGGFPDVISASSAFAAFEYLGMAGSDHPKEKIELVLMDITMPGIDGIQACRQIKADVRLKDTPVLIITGRPESVSLHEAFEAGASDFIRKPIDTATLLARVKAAVRLKREIDRREVREQELLEIKALLEVANAELCRLATLDGLTGVANRRRFDEYLEAEWRRCRRERRALGMILVDIDSFKSYNDAYGHLAGDACLKMIATALRGAIHRAGDLVARFGGEEFGIILPATPLPGALSVADRLREGVTALGVPHGGALAGVPVTVSIGLAATDPQCSGAPEDLLRAADTALYAAKQAGRDCIRFAGPDGAAMAPEALSAAAEAGAAPPAARSFSGRDRSFASAA